MIGLFRGGLDVLCGDVACCVVFGLVWCVVFLLCCLFCRVCYALVCFHVF